MKVINDLDELRTHVRDGSATKRALVPTMGALHAGHLSLCEIARRAIGKDGEVMATIFVNPTQFGPDEDLDAYPRELEADLEKCESLGVDVVFVPKDGSMYAEDASISISEDSLSGGLCGESRPAHFGGVCTIVAKLFNLTKPRIAVFGQKDFQQLAIIRRMVRDLNYDIEIVGGPTVREEDGLAMSSRNAFLTESERSEAPIIRKTLLATEQRIADHFKAPDDGLVENVKGVAKRFIAGIRNQFSSTNEEGTFDEPIGSVHEPTLLVREITETIETNSSGKVDYIEIVDPENLQPIEEIGPGTDLLIVAAVNFGKTRLIDNLLIERSSAEGNAGA